METKVRLLMADDSAIVRRAVCALLEPEAAITISGEAGNYTELVQMLRVSPPHVVLMDLRMPDENRFEPASIKKQLSGSCLLAMSVWADKETATLAESYGAMILLDKSNLVSTMLPAIEEYMRQRGKTQSA
jgi:DNA-binding NarL/FixJ family response regulator